jgi:tungstate transport system substrate-binding protein
MRSVIKAVIFLLIGTLTLSASEQPIRVAIIGGMSMSGLWLKVAASFESTYHIPIEVVITGTKHELDEYTRSHPVDLLTMHSSDTIVELASEGYVEKLTPWAHNAQMILGSVANPAQISENEPLSSALDKIKRSNAPFLIHASGGTFEVYTQLSYQYGFNPTDQNIVFTTQKRGFMKDVVEKNGYTLYGVIPFLMQKQHHPQIKGFIFDDPKLRRPYLAAVGTSSRITQEQYEKSLKLLNFLTSESTQTMVKDFRIEGFENIPVFFPNIQHPNLQTPEKNTKELP